MFQKIIIAGNVGATPEMRYTPAGIPVIQVSVATSKRTTDAEGNKHEKTIWWRVTFWRKTAETVAQFVEKGDKLLIVCELDEPRTYTDRQGAVRASLEATGESFTFISSKAEKEQRAATGNGQPQRSQAQAPHQDRVPTQQELVDEEQIPF